MMEARVILLEFNELTPRLMYRFMEDRRLPAFSRLYDESLVWTTNAEEQGTRLEPWIQWVTVHTGLPADRHQVFKLDEAGRCREPRVWDLISQAGKGPCWVCGSMNGVVQEGYDGYMLPDPWCSSMGPFPPGKFDTYYRFIRSYVQEYTNSELPLTAADYLRFAGWLAANGLSTDLLSRVLRQLAEERYRNVGWRRATVLDHMQWAVFAHHYRRLKPNFSTFFLNSTAHFQHVYWRNMEPALFKVKPDPGDQAAHGDAILFGYQSMDSIVAQVLELAGEDATVIFATALSQQPCLRYEETNGKVFYRPRRMERFLEFARIAEVNAVPVMSEEFILQARDFAHASEVAQRLRGLRVGERPAMYVQQDGDHVYSGCSIGQILPAEAVLEDADGAATPFFDLFYRAASLKSGMHHPDGMLWIRSPDRRHQVHDDPVSIRRIAPTVLEILGVDRPAHLQASLFEPARKRDAA